MEPPETGEYRFWISAGGGASLRLSPDSLAAGTREVASVAAAVAPGQWDAAASQRSAPVTLVHGRRYYLEILYKHSTGEDHCSVAWQRPQREREVVASRFLLPPSF